MKIIIEKLQEIFHKNNTQNEITFNKESNCYEITFQSSLPDRKVNISLNNEGYDLHFSINDFWCFCHHDYSADMQAFLQLIDALINEKIVGIKIERGEYVRDKLINIDEVDEYIRKQISYFEIHPVQNENYKFFIRSLKGTADKAQP